MATSTILKTAGIAVLAVFVVKTIGAKTSIPGLKQFAAGL